MRLQKVISNLRPELIQLGKYQLIKVTHAQAIKDLNQIQVDGILVEDDKLVKEVMMNDQLYLKPLFYLGETKKICDGTFDPNNSYASIQKIEILQESIKIYEDLTLPQENEKRLLTKLLRYLLSRRSTLSPINTRFSSIGYRFPLIEEMSIESDPLHIIKHLNTFAAEDYFIQKPLDKINICYECHSSYLNFSECCTKCNSLDLKTEELVHHFRCAYVGPQSDFTKDEKMICPKCDHQLKHIGIDYDKPSEIHTCKSCNHSSQETKMKAKCVDCSKENELDQLVTYNIYEYKPTEKARQLANQTQVKDSFGEAKSDAHAVLLNIGAYNLIKSHEGRKIRTGSMSTYDLTLGIHISLLEKLNKGMQTALLEEMATIVKPYLRNNDLLAIDQNNLIHALLIDYESDANRELEEILHYNLNKMLSDNGWGDQELVTIASQKINQ